MSAPRPAGALAALSAQQNAQLGTSQLRQALANMPDQCAVHSFRVLIRPAGILSGSNAEEGARLAITGMGMMWKRTTSFRRCFRVQTSC